VVFFFQGVLNRTLLHWLEPYTTEKLKVSIGLYDHELFYSSVMQILTSLLLTCSDGEPKEDLRRLKYVELFLTYKLSVSFFVQILF
jgi:hypothetical protein